MAAIVAADPLGSASVPSDKFLQHLVKLERPFDLVAVPHIFDHPEFSPRNPVGQKAVGRDWGRLIFFPDQDQRGLGNLL